MKRWLSYAKPYKAFFILGPLCMIIEVIGESGLKNYEADCYYQKFYPELNDRTRYFIKVQDGCDNFCSYCVIPYLRGRSRSRDVEDVLNELNGVDALEVVLTGINLTAYNYNGLKLPDLIDRLDGFPFRIRLGSLEDNVVSDRLLSSLKKLKDFAPHFHLSLQSGSDRVLKAMNRRYDTATFARSVELIRENFPDAGITTDVIVGYSTETDEDFEKTYKFCEEIGFSDIHCFVYSRREGTVGYKLKPLSDDVKRARLEKLLSLKSQLKRAFAEKHIGKELSLVPEKFENGYTEGYSGNYLRVYIEGDVGLNEIKTAVAYEIFNDGVKARLI